jgi:chitin synthase
VSVHPIHIFHPILYNILTSIRESVFGYITVLPGAFSAYRYIALQNDARGEGPLQKYFLGEKMVSALMRFLL